MAKAKSKKKQKNPSPQKVQRVKTGKEPTLKGNRYYAVKVVRKGHAAYAELKNLEQVRFMRDSLHPGSKMEVFTVTCNFREAWKR
jgi:hypothetical protein